MRASAGSERVDATSPVHRGTLPQDVEGVLRASALARDVPEDEVCELACQIAEKRAETDIRVAAACETDAGENLEVRAQFDGNPRYSSKKDVDTYKAAVARGMRRLYQHEALPTEIELRVARAVVATHGTERHGLALAMAKALALGTPGTADGLRNDRLALVADMIEGLKKMESWRERAFLRRVYRSFTGAEIRATCEGWGPVLERVPEASERAKVQESMQELHRKHDSAERAPWRDLYNTLVRTHGPERERIAERTRYRGLSAER